MKNFSDGGVMFFTNEDFDIREKINLSFNIGTDEAVEAEVLRFERTEVEAQPQADGEAVEIHRYQVAVKFLHTCQKQKNRFYKYIVEQQREIIRRQAKENTLLKA